MPRDDVSQSQAMPSDPKHAGYAPTVRSDWPTVPDTVQQALDTPSRAVVAATAPAKILGRFWLDTSATGTGGTGILTVNTITADTTLTTSYTVVLCDASAGAITLTLPAASANTGRMYHIKKIDSSGNAVTVDANANETIDGGLTAVVGEQYETITIVCDGSNWHVL